MHGRAAPERRTGGGAAATSPALGRPVGHASPTLGAHPDVASTLLFRLTRHIQRDGFFTPRAYRPVDRRVELQAVARQVRQDGLPVRRQRQVGVAGGGAAQRLQLRRWGDAERAVVAQRQDPGQRHLAGPAGGLQHLLAPPLPQPAPEEPPPAVVAHRLRRVEDALALRREASAGEGAECVGDVLQRALRSHEDCPRGRSPYQRWGRSENAFAPTGAPARRTKRAGG